LGHKVNPNGFRLGVIKGWDSRWFATRTYKDLVLEDANIRKMIQKRLANAAVARIEIERVAGTQISIAIHTAKPGIVIGKSGESVERLRQALEAQTKKKVRLSILEIRNPEVDAVLVARGIAEQIEKRISFRRAMKQAVQKSMRQGAKGIKVIVGGRLGGAEIARSEKEVEGSVPLQTLRANIDYGLAEAHTTYGVIGIKVWIYHGDVLPERQRAEGPRAAEPTATPYTGERPERGGGERGGPRGGFRGGERGGPRGGGERGGRPPADRQPRGGGDRGPRAMGERTSRAGASSDLARERTGGERRGGRPGPVTGGGPTGTPRAPRAEPRPRPDGGIEPGKGEPLPASGPVIPAPAAHEFPAPAANEGKSAEPPNVTATEPESSTAGETNNTNESGE
jgi:small subunit ribosomal protein S3